MVDIVRPEKRSKMMAGISGKNTKPELIVRKLIHSSGLRFRLHDKKLPGKPDIVLKKWGAVVLVDGCFWHGHENCHIFRLPKTRTEFWRNKISGNILRDKKNIKKLHELGWKTVRIWECALKGKKKLSHDELKSLIQRSIIWDDKPSEIYGRDRF